MRLLQVLRSLNPVHGGPIEAVRLLTVAHLADGHEVEIVSLDTPGEPLVPLPVEPYLLGPARGNYGHADKLVPWLRQNYQRFDAVIVNGLWQYQGLATRRVLHGTTTPYLIFPMACSTPGSSSNIQ